MEGGFCNKLFSTLFLLAFDKYNSSYDNVMYVRTQVRTSVLVLVSLPKYIGEAVANGNGVRTTYNSRRNYWSQSLAKVRSESQISE